MTLPKTGSLELRIMELVRDHYPITRDELKRRLGVSDAKLDLALKRLVQRGIVEYDVLPDKKYIRLKVIPAGKGRKKAGNDRNEDFSYM